ncbi:DMT family transporter [uncultured Desulfobacter sp.]|uniref:DMT family transporter n=1 Tax=uncultured Desulfobacter sp. TaxID=240139 RepID=UPI002AAC348B|nr:DMT family transporter [uncultured Desulfobacter sp.]
MDTLKPQLNIHSSSEKTALIAACGAGVMWGTGALVVNILVGQYGFTPENVSFWRFVIGAVVLIGIFGRGIMWTRLRPLLLTVILAGTAMAGYVLLWFLGIKHMGPAVPTLIALCLPPVIVTIIGIARGQEVADLQLLLVLSGAILGTVLIINRHGAATADVDSHNTLLGVVFSIGSALLYAGFSMISGKISIALGAGQATACLTVIAAIVMGLTSLLKPLTWPTEFPPQAWFLYLGLVTAALALLAFNWGAARLKPTALTIATLLEPLTAVVLSALILGQYFGLLQWIGSSFLLLSIWGLNRRALEKGKS